MSEKSYKTSERKRARRRQRYHEDEEFRNYWKGYSKEYNKDPENKTRKATLGKEWRHKTKYGMTLEQRDQRLLDQDSRCTICKREILFVNVQTGASAINAAHVDHCHTTNVVRGILCRGCNVGLGQFEDDSTRLRKAADYLELYRPAEPSTQLSLEFTPTPCEVRPIPTESLSVVGSDDVLEFLLWHDPQSLQLQSNLDPD